MSDDLISRSAVKDIAAKHGATEDFDLLIDQIPSVDAEPVRHGRWDEPYPNDMWDCYKCSCCDYTDDRKYNFCPNCGAEMGGVENRNSSNNA